MLGLSLWAIQVWPGPQHALFNPAPGAPRPIARWAPLYGHSGHLARLRLEGHMNYLHCLEASKSLVNKPLRPCLRLYEQLFEA